MAAVYNPSSYRAMTVPKTDTYVDVMSALGNIGFASGVFGFLVLIITSFVSMNPHATAGKTKALRKMGSLAGIHMLHGVLAIAILSGINHDKRSLALLKIMLLLVALVGTILLDVYAFKQINKQTFKQVF